MKLSRYVPWLLAGLGAIYLMMTATSAKDSENGMHLADFGRLPVVHDGRIKPFDSLARHSLMIISGRQYVVDNNGNEQSAMKWLLDVMTSRVNREPAEKAKVFRIENDHLQDLLGLSPRSGFRYAIDEFADKLPKLADKATRAQQIPAKQQDKFDVKSIELAQHLQTYIGNDPAGLTWRRLADASGRLYQGTRRWQRGSGITFLCSDVVGLRQRRCSIFQSRVGRLSNLLELSESPGDKDHRFRGLL